MVFSPIAVLGFVSLSGAIPLLSTRQANPGKLTVMWFLDKDAKVEALQVTNVENNAVYAASCGPSTQVGHVPVATRSSNGVREILIDSVPYAVGGSDAIQCTTVKEDAFDCTVPWPYQQPLESYTFEALPSCVRHKAAPTKMRRSPQNLAGNTCQHSYPLRKWENGNVKRKVLHKQLTVRHSPLNHPSCAPYLAPLCTDTDSHSYS
jgi:hypothetical protein